MSVRRAEKAIQVAAIVGIWIPFALARGLVEAWGRYFEMIGIVFCGPAWSTGIWLGIAQSDMTLIFPAGLSLVSIWTMKAQAQHGNWVAGIVLCCGLLFAVASFGAVTAGMYKFGCIPY